MAAAGIASRGLRLRLHGRRRPRNSRQGARAAGSRRGRDSRRRASARPRVSPSSIAAPMAARRSTWRCASRCARSPACTQCWFLKMEPREDTELLESDSRRRPRARPPPAYRRAERADRVPARASNARRPRHNRDQPRRQSRPLARRTNRPQTLRRRSPGLGKRARQTRRPHRRASPKRQALAELVSRASCSVVLQLDAEPVVEEAADCGAGYRRDPEQPQLLRAPIRRRTARDPCCARDSPKCCRPGC